MIIKGAGEEHVVPLTQPCRLWTHFESTTCARLGIGFAVQWATDLRLWFHYGFPEDIGCTSVLVEDDRVLLYVYHDFPRGVDWLQRCHSAVHGLETTHA